MTRMTCLDYFKKICSIPHASAHEAALVDYLESFGKELGLETLRDFSDNLIIKKPATPGYEAAPPVILQGHTDMVCVARDGVDFDFLTTPITLIQEGDILRADGTTLGGDDGTAIAHMMALLSDQDFPHPALECLFTSKEELGLLGAIDLDTTPLTGRTLIAMDAGFIRDNVTTVSCAGGRIVELVRPAEWETVSGETLTLSISGLLGGHSAMTIDKGRGNAIKLMGRILMDISRVLPLQLLSISGGSKMNAIPASCEATLCVSDAAAAARLAEQTAAAIRSELSGTDDGFTFLCAEGALCDQARALSLRCTNDLLQLIYLMFDGLRSMSLDFPGLVAASSNLGVLRLSQEELRLTLCSRAAEDSLRDLIIDEILSLAGLLSFASEEKGLFSGWKFDPHSELRSLTQQLYLEMFGEEMEMVATHGGMEIGTLKAKLPHLDIVSIAPINGNPHTPDEYIDLNSFARFYELLKRLLGELGKKSS